MLTIGVWSHLDTILTRVFITLTGRRTGNGTDRLTGAVLASSVADRTNYLGMLLTAAGRSSALAAVLSNGNQPDRESLPDLAVCGRNRWRPPRATQ
jgi:hypothetical protein